MTVENRSGSLLEPWTLPRTRNIRDRWSHRWSEKLSTRHRWGTLPLTGWASRQLWLRIWARQNDCVLLSAINPKGVTYSMVGHKRGSIRLMKNRYCIAIVDHNHRLNSVKMIGDKDDVEWAVEQLCLLYVSRVDRKPTSPAPEIKQIKVANILGVTVRH